MDEIIDVLDELGNETNKSINKKEAHKKGLWHKAIHILIVNKDHTKTLVQKRTKDKELYPDTWDISVGGHVSTKETYLDAAKREVEEELGLKKEFTFQELTITKESFKNNNIISNEYVCIYLIEEDIDINEITLQKEEVSCIKWIDKKELNELIKNNKIIPHTKEYEILNEILK